MDNDARYVGFGNALVGFRGVDVLEVGGCISPELIAPHGPKTWTSIDINPRRFAGRDKALSNGRFFFEQMSATNITFPGGSFDRIFSINSFEHIDDVETALSEAYKALKPGGLLFSLFGPIWSGPVGHHTWVTHEDRIYHFGQNVFPDWHHLAHDKSELREFLSSRYGDEVSDKIIAYVYDSDDLNRLTDGDFLDIVRRSDFSKQFLFLNKRRRRLEKSLHARIREKYPNIRDPRTTEILLVLSKGPISVVKQSRIYKGLLKEFSRKAFKRVANQAAPRFRRLAG